MFKIVDSRRDGGRSRGFRERDSRDRGRDSRRPRDSKPKSERRAPVSAEDLDKEMDSYMKSNVSLVTIHHLLYISNPYIL